MVSVKATPGNCSSPGEQPASPRGPCTAATSRGGQQPSASSLRDKLKELLKRLKPSRSSSSTLVRFESAPSDAVTRSSTRCETTGESASSNVTDYRHGESSDIAGGSDSGYSPHSSAAFASNGGASGVSGGTPPMGSSPPYQMTLTSRNFLRNNSSSSTRFGGGGGSPVGGNSAGGGLPAAASTASKKVHPVDLPSPVVAVVGSGGNHSPFEHPGEVGRFLRASLFTRRSNSSPQNEMMAMRPEIKVPGAAAQPAQPASPQAPRGSSGAVMALEDVSSPVFPMGGGLPSPAGMANGSHHALLSCLSGDFFTVMPSSSSAAAAAAVPMPAPALPPSAPVVHLRTAASATVVSSASAGLVRMTKDNSHSSGTLLAPHPPPVPPQMAQQQRSLRGGRLGSGAVDEAALALAAAASASTGGAPQAGIDIDGGSPTATVAGGSVPLPPNTAWMRRGSAPEAFLENYLASAPPVNAPPPAVMKAPPPQQLQVPPPVRTVAPPPSSGSPLVPTGCGGGGLEVVTPGSTPRLLVPPAPKEQQLPPAAGSAGCADGGGSFGSSVVPGTAATAAAAAKLSLPQLLRSVSTANAQLANPYINPVINAQCASRQNAYRPPEAAKLSAVVAAAAAPPGAAPTKARPHPPPAPAPADVRRQQAAAVAAAAARDGGAKPQQPKVPAAEPAVAAAGAAVQDAPVDVGVEADDAEAVAPPSLLLCVSPALPKAMDRNDWSLEDYTVVKRLYKGSSAAVYRATCNRSGMPVALKVYFLSRLPDAVKHMVVRELEIHSSAIHPNIIQLYAAFETEKHVVLVMEYASRGDLYGIQRATAEHPFGRRQDEGRVVSVVLRPLLTALAFLHSRGICHRDIKPENVLFTSNWQLKLADFGVSIDLGRERAVTRAGTTCYMAPEVVRCPLKHRPEDNKNDPRLAYGTACDIWAVGVLAYELLVGFTPLAATAGPNPNVAADAKDSTLMFPGTTSAAARTFVSWCLADHPEDRPTAFQLLHHEWLYPAGASAAVAAAMSSANVVTTAQMVAAAVQAEARICCSAGHS
ncbi:hypothetical protein HXX76_008448 [Chlamydomonas incerta]|uniref:Protein kinase domain-containing protein n=1 Tax=Chlamydomonas incerta TaxID=51695 RepID=A0A835SUN0_CHLIN|nr:hypothetical protein HXX76_008448 [Chlamydomonas incerta]|eukprot:KAG2433388.1 hypothetical protein HXX76_008448 [Chlamydomonas incerta]